MVAQLATHCCARKSEESPPAAEFPAAPVESRYRHRPNGKNGTYGATPDTQQSTRDKALVRHNECRSKKLSEKPCDSKRGGPEVTLPLASIGPYVSLRPRL